MEENKKNVPKCIGIIMDGNRRWAKANGLPVFEGHRAGYNKLREMVDWCKEAGVKNLVVYAFSTENWNRTKEEVKYLMDLFREVVERMIAEALRNDTRLIFLGERNQFEKDIFRAIEDGEERTRQCKSFFLGIALSYGGRGEILDAIHRIPKEKASTLSEQEFSQLLFTKDIPDPDIIIRTSGEHRLSGFLPWQGVYSELFFIDTLWPAFTREEFNRILGAYATRERRYGA